MRLHALVAECYRDFSPVIALLRCFVVSFVTKEQEQGQREENKDDATAVQLASSIRDLKGR
jgi:hypothetical protein